jgi:mannose-6-phosphate isomerase-like protein (cupin superfamily)
METVTIDEVDNYAGPHDVKRPLSRALGAEDHALNYYELAPGESFAFGYHSHEDQEEVFVVLDGTVTFETAEGTVAVGPGEAVRFAPGESQRGVNAAPEDGEGERVRALAIGAPQDAGQTHVLRECAGCGQRTPADIQRADDGEALVTICLECGLETGRFED